MKLQKIKGPLCMPASMAMLFDTTVEDIISFIGHHGLDVVDGKYSGIHIQEMQRYALHHGYALVCYEPMPNLQGRVVNVWKEDFPLDKFEGLLLGETEKGGFHCVAWDKFDIFNPTDAELVGFHQFWAKVKI